MADSSFFENVIGNIGRSSTEATVSMLGISHKGLREHLLNELGSKELGSRFLADPVFEAMFPWEKAEPSMASLKGSLLQPSLVDAMDKAKDSRFGANWNPFKHQLVAWETLLGKKNRSIVVTSGTGSGKTECFMVPVLCDLAREYEETAKKLTGVRALFIYPLNALINSQRERLRAWTDAYGDGIRFCLYNGNTEENKHHDQGKYPNEILTRKLLRQEPAPILVTNATMLEYMLIRQIDQPIIRESRGKLRWIVLDEAHTYMGSQAAELSLLLRRVMHSFGVEAKNVRFVATSATIGDDDSSKILQEYLANLAGISVDKISVVGGRREVPPLPKATNNNSQPDDLASIDAGDGHSDERFASLSGSKVAVSIRKALTESGHPLKLSDIAKIGLGDNKNTAEAIKWIDISSFTLKPGPNPKKPAEGAVPFLPIRTHLFHQVMSGLWCCVNKHCTAKSHTPLKDSWPFGKVYIERKNHCECGAPLFELLFCNDCNTPYLLSSMKDNRLLQQDRESVDEFSLDIEGDDDEADDSQPSAGSSSSYVISPIEDQTRTFRVSITASRDINSTGQDTYDICLIDDSSVECIQCNYEVSKGNFYRRSMLGTPFYISNSVPLLLETCQESENPNENPSRGKRLITFTDSRQGTARISTKVQQDSERDCIRGLAYSLVAQNVSSLPADELERDQNKLIEYQSKIDKFRKMDEPDLAREIENLAANMREKLSNIGKLRPVYWGEAVADFKANKDVSQFIYDYYKDLNPQLFGDSSGVQNLLEMLLLREFARRPKRQNSLETLGLVSVQYPVLKEIKTLPKNWQERGFSLQDWQDLLKVILDFFVRENSIINIPKEWVNWMGAKIYAKSVMHPNADEKSTSVLRRWPQVVPGKNNRIVRLLSLATNLDYQSPNGKDFINGVLVSAWQMLTSRHRLKNSSSGETEEHQILKLIPGTMHYQLDRKEMAFQACQEAWVCPITHRFIDTTFKGLTPYLPNQCTLDQVACHKVSLPIMPADCSQYTSDSDRKNSIRNWISSQEAIKTVRAENLWTDVSDRILESRSFFRAAEHSAQQPASKLKKYEALFKTGRLNILSCSTTMEMGVDIGGISTVVMNNVPPHPANYLQRAGRAGRRGETQALAFTICKDNPHERSVFLDPLWPFETKIPAPYITLSSDRIVQRHVNALLLAYFLKEVIAVTSTSTTNLPCEWFFYSEPSENAPVERMIRWLESFKLTPIPEELATGIKSVIFASSLAEYPIQMLVQASADALKSSRENWLPVYLRLKILSDSVASLSDKDPFKRKIGHDLSAMGSQYLLSELASKAFLPGYGFPTGVVTFDHYSMFDFLRNKYVTKDGRIDNMTRMRERPAREMAVAIREYAPGSQVVLDGLVYKSQGVLLSKYAPDGGYSEPQRMMKQWRCHSCGCIGNESGIDFDGLCSECGSTIEPGNVREYIEPIGFAVDFYSEPSTDISHQAFIPVQEPWVTANAPLVALFEPKIGSNRSSAEGHIFHHSSGVNGHGYAVCLRCGRASSMEQANAFPPNLLPGTPHVRLQGKPDKSATHFCEGADEVYSIKDSVHLGATDQTDICELYLKLPSEDRYLKHSTRDPLAWTLAVAFRQALADIHGINADEIGYTIKPSTIKGCTYAVVGVVLFDRAGGGAGFASSAPRYMDQIIRRSIDLLECTDNCDSACQSCLMGYDTRFHLDVLNRHVAKEYLCSLLPYLDLPVDARILGKTTKYCFESLSSEILSCIRGKEDELFVFTSGLPTDWDIDGSDLKQVCLTWKSMFSSVNLVVPKNNLPLLDEYQKESFLALGNLGIKLRAIDAYPSVNGAVLAQIKNGNQTITFATTLQQAAVPNVEWQDASFGYLVRSDDFPLLNTSDIPKDHLSVKSLSGDVEVEISSECDGKLQLFGEKFWQLLVGASPELSSKIGSGIELLDVEYSDSYVCSPWSLLLLGELVDGLKQKLGGAWSVRQIGVNTSDKISSMPSKGLYSEWPDNFIKARVIKGYFDYMGESCRVDVRPLREMPHGRILRLVWSDKAETLVRLDHGVGCWSLSGKSPVWLDVADSDKEQVDAISKCASAVYVKYGKKFPTQTFIKHR